MIEAVNGIRGALRLAARDPGGLGWFDTSLSGFWRSFQAAIIVLPAFALLVATRPANPDLSVGPAGFVLVEAIAYVTGWFAFPFVMLYVVPLLDRQERFIPYIVAVNWSNVVQTTVYSTVVLIDIAGVVPDGVMRFVGLVAFLWILSYQWFIARVGLNVNGAVAAGIVLIDLVLSLLITGAAQSIET